MPPPLGLPVGDGQMLRVVVVMLLLLRVMVLVS